MKWLAHIRRGSTTDRMWRSRQQCSGVLAGIVFRSATPNGLFASEGPLTVDQVAIARGPRFADVVLEAAGSAPAPVDETPPAPLGRAPAARQARRGR